MHDCIISYTVAVIRDWLSNSWNWSEHNCQNKLWLDSVIRLVQLLMCIGFQELAWNLAEFLASYACDTK